MTTAQPDTAAQDADGHETHEGDTFDSGQHIGLVKRRRLDITRMGCYSEKSS